MALPSGLAAQLGIKAESVFGTYVAVDRFYEFVSANMKLNQESIDSEAMRSGDYVLRSDRTVNNRKGASGSVSLEVANKSFGLWLYHWFGAVAVTTPGGGSASRNHTHTIGDLSDDSFSMQVGKPDTGGTVRPFSYVGCNIMEAELVQEIDGLLMLNMEIDAQDETTGESLESISYPSALTLYEWGDAAATIDGSAFVPDAFSFKMTTGLKADRYGLQASQLKRQHLPNARRELTGEITGEFEDLTLYAEFQARTPVPIVVTWTGAVIEGAIPFKITLTLPECEFSGETPDSEGPDLLKQPLPFRVLDDGSNEPATLVYTTTDTAS